MTRQSQRLTQADELKLIEFHIYKTKKKLFEVNKTMRFYQITGIDITHSEVMMTPIKLHWNIFAGLKERLKKMRLKNIAAKNSEA